MPTAPLNISDLLLRLGSGEGTVAELINLFRSIATLLVVTPPAPLLRELVEQERADNEPISLRTADQTRLGALQPNVAWSETDAHLCGTLDDQERFILAVFSDLQIAANFARRLGVIRGNEQVSVTNKQCVACLHEALIGEYGGIAIDPISDHEIFVDRGALADIFAALTAESFVRLPMLYPVHGTRDAVIIVQNNGVPSAYVFDSEKAAFYGLPWLQARVLGDQADAARIGQVPPLTLIRDLDSLAVKQIFINPGLADARSYRIDDLAKPLRDSW